MADADADAGPIVDLSGRWAMFWFEDPVAVEITQKGDRLTGIGCYGGLPAADAPQNLERCVDLNGTVSGLHVQFKILSPMAAYETDVYASADGQRMAGRFHDVVSWSAPFTWLRIGPTDRWMPFTAAPTVSAALATRANRWVLTPAGPAPPDLEIDQRCGPSPCIDLTLGLREADGNPLLNGTLGAFWGTELTWDEPSHTLVAGPVPATSPKLPTELSLAFDGTTLLTVDATMPSGGVYHLMATLVRPPTDGGASQ